MNDFNYERHKQIEELFKINNGIVSTSKLMDVGINRTYISKLCNEGVITRIKRGVYELTEGTPNDDVEIISKLLPEAVICLNSALYYYQYTDRTPLEWHIAVSKDINKSKLKINYPPIRPYYWENEIYRFGITTGEINNNQIKVYDRDRTMCDVIRYSNKMDREIFNKAIESYIKDSKKNINNLLSYAEKLKVSQKVKILIGGRL